MRSPYISEQSNDGIDFMLTPALQAERLFVQSHIDLLIRDLEASAAIRACTSTQ
jgi:hypothetical protein